VLGIHISKERNMLVAEKFIKSLMEKYGRHTVYTDDGTWYSEICSIIGLKHHLHSQLEKT
jgi:putative transposase